MKLDKETAAMLETYFAGDPTPEIIEAMQAWLRRDKANPRLLAEYGLIDRLIAHEQKNEDASAIFATLLEAEEAAEPIAFPAPGTTHEQAKPKRDDAITFKQAGSALSYLAKQTLRSRAGWMTGIAAVLVLAGLLAFVFAGGNDASTPQAPLAKNDTPPTTPFKATPARVATLTATHNAKWAPAERASTRGPNLKTGDTLAAGQRLNLTQGLAEITTRRGAVVVLEAPCAVALMGDGHALRLHTGKLVGICETESSKGFVVRTTQMNITDLGTRFGVDASEPGRVEVHVFAGEVDLQQADAVAGDNAWSQRLFTGQAARLVEEKSTPSLIDARMDRFTLNDDFLAELPGTGFGVEPGQTDPNWQIVAYQGQPLDQPWQPIAINLAYGVDNIPNHPQRTQWLNWHQTKRTADLTESYVFQTRIQLPESIDPATARLVIDCSTDNQLAAIHVNGERSPVSSAYGGFESERFEITEGLIPGENTIGFEVNNLWPEDADDNFENGVGLRVGWRLHGRTKQTD